jgi:nitrite reductase/ring-hydroxylating ferredoxin subunit
MNRFFSLDAQDPAGLRLRAAVFSDAGLLPAEKDASNAVRASRCEAYLGRANDHFFIVESAGRPVGTIGAALDAGAAEIYGARTLSGDSAALQSALLVLLTYLRGEKISRASCRAPSGDPLMDWARREGFASPAEGGEVWALDIGRVRPLAFKRALPGAEGAPPHENCYPIPLDPSRLTHGRPTAARLDEDVEAVAVLTDHGPKVFLDVCPHMGAPLSRGSYSPLTCALHCPWHGYHFDTRTGEMAHNPNDAIFAPLKKPFEAARKGPAARWRLRPLTQIASGGKIWIKREAP